MQGVGVPASDSMPYPHSHSLDSVAEMVTVSNVVGMIGTEAGLSVQVAAMKVQWYGLLPSPRLSLHHTFLPTDGLAPHPRSLHIPPRGPMPRLALRQPRRVRYSPLQHPRSPEASRRIAGACARTKPARPVDATRIRARPLGPADSARDG